VVGVPEPRLGEVPVALVALVALDDASDAPPEQELVDWVRERVAPYKVPVQVVAADAIPLNSMLKVDRRSIRATIAAASD
jgi:acyl-coenzyme A synthetase/AMP-(fatty) acid ligase